MSITQTPYTIIITMTATPAWLTLSRAERNHFTTTILQPLFVQWSDRVQVRFFDAEAFTAHCSDVAISTTLDLKAYYFLMEQLRDTPLFAQPYFLLNDVIIGLENGYQAFEKTQPFLE